MRSRVFEEYNISIVKKAVYVNGVLTSATNMKDAIKEFEGFHTAVKVQKEKVDLQTQFNKADQYFRTLPMGSKERGRAWQKLRALYLKLQKVKEQSN